MKKTKLRIHTWPEKILRKKSKKVKEVNDQIRDYLDEMLSLMRLNKGLGLAANQAGLNLRLIVLGVNEQVFKLVNPEIIKGQGSICFFEGCLSFPGLELEIKRRNKIWVRALDETGKPLDLEAEGLLSVVLQHEIDHIRGVVFIDRLSFWQRVKIAPQLKKIAKKKNDGLLKQE